MRDLNVTDIFKEKLNAAPVTDSLTAGEKYDAFKQPLRKYHYTLDMFMRMPEIFPIYFNQTYFDFKSTNKPKERNIAGLDIRHSYFAFYYNVLTREYKILLYLTASNAESGYGVLLDTLQENSYTVTTGDDIKALKDTQDIMFMREHLEGLHRIFKNKSIKNTMRNLRNIIDRMTSDPVSLSGTVYPSNLMLPKEFDTKYYRYTQLNFPIERKFEPRTNVFSTKRNFSGINYTVVTMHKDVVGFQDFNFITSAIALLPQYKMLHRFQDWIKRVFPNK